MLASNNTDTLILEFIKSPIMKKWHWLQYHFDLWLRFGKLHPVVRSLLRHLAAVDKVVPDYSKKFIKRLSSLGGREKDIDQYEQILQLFSELLVVSHLTTVVDCDADRTLIDFEPLAQQGYMNVEVKVQIGGHPVLVEVKSPRLYKHMLIREESRIQHTVRYNPSLFPQGEGLLPRDNPIRDFLLSAERKFALYKNARDVSTFGILIIVWDDFIYEPISGLLSPVSGLFTNNSFARDESNCPLRFTNVNGVVIIRHLHQFMWALADRPLFDGKKEVFEYGLPGEFPFKAFIQNPYGSRVPSVIIDAFQALQPSRELGAEYTVQDVVFTVDLPSGKGQIGLTGLNHLSVPIERAKECLAYIEKSVEDLRKEKEKGV